MKRLLTLLFFTSQFWVNGQNLVPNFSFDIQDSCPAVSELFVCPPWDSPTLGSPDAYNDTCPTQNPAGRTGMGSAGVYLLNSFANNREYMQAPLSSPLVGGLSYFVSFWVKRVNYRYASNRIGAYLSNGALNQTSTGVLPYSPQVDNPPSNMLNGTDWILISGSFVASGGEDHIVIGSFNDDNETDTVVANATNSSNVSYYRVDDVSVIQLASGFADNDLYNKVSIYPNPSEGKFSIIGLPDQTEIIIYNTMGQIISESFINNPEINFDLNLFPEGMYYLHLRKGDMNSTKKIFINKFD